MPHPLLYNGTQDDDKIRSIDNVHIEPSIREGVHLVSSLYGVEASAPIYRYPPTNTYQPYITGSFQIPNTLTCNSGQWDGSPTPVLTYQWMIDGNDIPGEVSKTLETIPAWDEGEITCEVKGLNVKGEAYAITSNSITLSLINPIELNDFDFSIVTGWSLKSKIIERGDKNVILTGLGALNTNTALRSVAYFVLGVSADLRDDINSLFFNVITGVDKYGNIHETEESIMSVNYTDYTPLVTSEPQNIQIKNNTAKLGILGWEVFGNATYHSFKGSSEDPYSFMGGLDSLNLNMPYSYLYQDVPLDSQWLTDVDAGDCFVELNWLQSSYEKLDEANVKLEFLDASKTVIGSNDGPGFFSSYAQVWISRDHEAPIPVNTRYIRIYLEFIRINGNNNDGYIDYINASIRKGVKLVSRDFGPTFSNWRIRFTQFNSYSGCALSELEFRDSIGGVDLASGGTPLFGSSGLGGDVSYAFDDLRNTGYWAGEEGGVANNTSWIGYNFGSPNKPVEIDITARTGSNAYQVGSAFFLEGSDNGLDWIKVQEFNEIPLFSSGQQKQFVVADGTFDWWIETSMASTSHEIKLVSSSASLTKGDIFRAKARLTIKEISAFLGGNIEAEYTICKIGFENSAGLVKEPIQQYTVSSNPVPSWNTIVLSEDFIVEVGEYFAILATSDDFDFMYYYQNQGDTFGSYPTVNGSLAARVTGWRSNHSHIELHSSKQNESSGFYAVDFKGLVF